VCERAPWSLSQSAGQLPGVSAPRPPTGESPRRQVQLKDTKSVVGRLRLVLRLLLHLLAAFFYLVIFEARPRPLRQGIIIG